jgi:hypothetical protein
MVYVRARRAPIYQNAFYHQCFSLQNSGTFFHANVPTVVFLVATAGVDFSHMLQQTISEVFHPMVQVSFLFAV